MFPIKSSDAYIKDNGKRSTIGAELGAGGGSDLPEYSQADAGKVLKVGDDGDLEWDQPDPGVTWLTAQQWNALTFEEQKALGFTAIGTDGDISGKYYDYSTLESLWKLNQSQPNVIDFIFDTDYTFHGFYSNTIGDVVASQGRGGTRLSGAKAVITAFTSGNYCGFLMFARTSSDLQCENTSYYSILEVDEYGIYVGGNFSGAWTGDPQVSLTHDGTTQNLHTMFTTIECAIPAESDGTKLHINSDYRIVMLGIIDYLNSN